MAIYTRNTIDSEIEVEDYEQFVLGDQPQEKKCKYREADDRILTIVNSYASRDVIEYLRDIAMNFL